MSAEAKNFPPGLISHQWLSSVLLITFFVFTTLLGTPTTMRLVLPKDTKDSSFTASGKTIGLLLVGSDIVYYYYNGDSVNYMHVANSPNEIRNVLQHKKRRMQ